MATTFNPEQLTAFGGSNYPDGFGDLYALSAAQAGVNLTALQEAQDTVGFAEELNRSGHLIGNRTVPALMSRVVLSTLPDFEPDYIENPEVESFFRLGSTEGPRREPLPALIPKDGVVLRYLGRSSMAFGEMVDRRRIVVTPRVYIDMVSLSHGGDKRIITAMTGETVDHETQVRVDQLRVDAT